MDRRNFGRIYFFGILIGLFVRSRNGWLAASAANDLAAISGRVHDAGGSPITGALVLVVAASPIMPIFSESESSSGAPPISYAPGEPAGPITEDSEGYNDPGAVASYSPRVPVGDDSQAGAFRERPTPFPGDPGTATDASPRSRPAPLRWWLLGAVLFYILTNTQAWWGDVFYAKTLAGWWQALTVGHPEYPPTIFFFRNTLVSDLLFTGVFAVTMEYAARRAGRPSLLEKRAEA